MKNDHSTAALQEVCGWMDLAAERTNGMSRAELIAYYLKEAEALKRQRGLESSSRPAGSVEEVMR